MACLTNAAVLLQGLHELSARRGHDHLCSAGCYSGGVCHVPSVQKHTSYWVLQTKVVNNTNAAGPDSVSQNVRSGAAVVVFVHN